MTQISAMVLTHNAEQSLARCLASLQWVDEIVVLDDCSTDRTPEIAAQFTEHIYTRKLENFSAQRNAALAHCTGVWVLVVDADEWLTPELRAKIVELLAREPTEHGYRIPRKNLFIGQWIRGWRLVPELRIALISP